MLLIPYQYDGVVDKPLLNGELMLLVGAGTLQSLSKDSDGYTARLSRLTVCFCSSYSSHPTGDSESYRWLPASGRCDEALHVRARLCVVREMVDTD